MICNKKINACNAIMILGYINGHSSHFPGLNHGCKIECLQDDAILRILEHIRHINAPMRFFCNLI